MSLVEADHAFEILARPVDDLLQTAVITPRRTEGRIGHEQDALLERDRLVDLPIGERLDIGGEAAQRRPVAARVFQERLVPEYDDRLVVDYESPVKEDRSFSLQVSAAFPWLRTVDELRVLGGLPATQDTRVGELHPSPPSLAPLGEEPAEEPAEEERLSGAERAAAEALSLLPAEALLAVRRAARGRRGR